MRRPEIFLVGLLACASLALSTTSCEETTCGPGTVEESGECVPLQPANCTGDGVSFEHGRCVPNFSEVCGDGTHASDTGQCVPTGGVADPTPDMGRDVPDDPGLDLSEDVVPDSVADVVDLEDEETGEYDPMCADDLNPVGSPPTVCVWGRVVNFLDGSAVPSDADPPLQVQTKDLTIALGDPGAVLDESLVEAGGYFSMPSAEMADQPPRQVILVVGEVEEVSVEGPGAVWQRSISGLFITSDAVDTFEYDTIPTATIPRASVTLWNTELGLTDADVLEATGFFVARVIDAMTGAPIQGATLECIGCGTVDIDYFNDTQMQSFGGTSTGPTGAVLLRGSAATDLCTANATGFTAASPVSCGTFPGRASLNIIRMVGN